jgi:hypothetical protein
MGVDSGTENPKDSADDGAAPLPGTMTPHGRARTFEDVSGGPYDPDDFPGKNGDFRNIP